MTVRVGLFLSRQALQEDPAEWREQLGAMADAGIDHVGAADHVSFHTGWGIDGIVHAATLAAMEPRLSVAIGVYLLPLRHPVPVARQLVTLGAALGPHRELEFGVGVGGEDRHEVEICGVDPSTRGRRMDECMAIIRGLLTGEPLDFEGEFFSLSQARIVPLPPRPIPILVGGRTEAALRRAGRYGDGWLGIWTTPDRFAARTAGVVDAAEAAGRGAVNWRHGLQLWVGYAQTKVEARAPVAAAIEAMYQLPFDRFEKFTPYGTPSEIAEFLRGYVEAGCTSFNIAGYPASGEWRDAVVATAEVRRLLNARA